MSSSRRKKSSKSRAEEADLVPRGISTPSPSRSSHQSNDASDDEIALKHLSQAAAKFSGFIGQSAFLGRVADFSSSWEQDGGRACVWLSESAMVSSSLRPGSYVSASLANPSKALSGEFLLDSVVDACAKFFCLDARDCLTNESGNYFAIAKIFSSQKVLKNEVRLSWSLSSTMGFPAAGKLIFVFPLENLCSSSNVLSTCGMNNSIAMLDDASASRFINRKLNLKLVRQSADQRRNIGGESPVSGLKNSMNIPSAEASPPKTPVPNKKLQNDASGLPTPLNPWHSVISGGLEDEKSNELLRTYAVRWFHGRYVLKGNILALPIFGQLCAFQVENSVVELVGASDVDQVQFYGQGKSSDSTAFASDIFLFDSGTKVHFTLTPTIKVSPKEDTCGIETKNFKLKTSSEIPRLGGLSKEYSVLKEVISFSFSHQSSLMRYKGVLLYGPPGTGKTTLARSCVHDAGVKLFVINGPEVVSEYFGESEQKLLEVFDSARKSTPAVVFIDELDAIAPARQEGGEGLSRRIVATLLEFMDGIIRSDGVLVIAATNRPESIEPALRRPGRLDKEIEIGVPTRDQRLDILSGILSGMHHALSDEQIQSLALETHGFVGADLSALCNEAAMIALRRFVKVREINKGEEYEDQKPSSKCEGENNMDSVILSLSRLDVSSNGASSPEGMPKRFDFEHDSILGAKDLSDLQIRAEDFDQAKLKVRPSAMREVMLEVPRVRWEDVGGHKSIKNQLIEAVQWPQTCPDSFKRMGIRPPRGLLIFGPPGCSKTLLARAVASEAKLNFIAVKGPELLSKWVGESEKAVSSLFAKARANSPSIIFFDEIDGLVTTRGRESDGTCVGDRVMNQLLIELDGLDVRFGVTVIAATNRPDKIDPALLRPGRFDRHLDVMPPEEEDRAEIFLIHTRGTPVGGDVAAGELASLTEGYSGADIKLVCREAAIAALEESFETEEISMRHFRAAVERVKPAVDARLYLDIAAKFRRFVQVEF
ncbi:cam interacting protein 111 [Wolffia australiana]